MKINMDDVTYVVCLLMCIVTGSFIRKLANEGQRKTICTLFGITMAFAVSGIHGLHFVVSYILGTAAMIYVHPSKCHLVSFVCMFSYLIFFRFCTNFGFPEPPGPANMIQMVHTLKVAGVAFEKTAAWKKIQQKKKEDTKEKSDVDLLTKQKQSVTEITEYDIEIQHIGFVEVFHYTFCYIGLLTGPYFRYRTYRDYFKTPFKNYAPNVTETLSNLKYAAVYAVLYLIASYIYPLQYALSDEFYNERTIFYRLFYIWPTFFIFRMRMYTGLILSECVCTMAGFGAYPIQAESANGEGPKKDYMHLTTDAHRHSYNFTTIVNQRVKCVETCITFREGMKHWNLCVQYWLAVNVYKLFPSKKYRTLVTLLCSAYWHGFRPGHYFCIMGAPFYVPIEDMWNNLIRKDRTGLKRQIIDVIFWYGKFFSFSYLGTAFLLVSFKNIWKFYNSVYHIGYITWAVLFVTGIIFSKQKKIRSHQKHLNEKPKQIHETTGLNDN